MSKVIHGAQILLDEAQKAFDVGNQERGISFINDCVEMLTNGLKNLQAAPAEQPAEPADIENLKQEVAGLGKDLEDLAGQPSESAAEPESKPGSGVIAGPAESESKPGAGVVSEPEKSQNKPGSGVS